MREHNGKKEQDSKKKPKKSIKAYSYYNVTGESLEKKNRPCPKCGDGVFLAKHKERLTCGKCSYMEKA